MLEPILVTDVSFWNQACFSTQMKYQMDCVNQMIYKIDYVRCEKKRKQKLKGIMIH